MLLKFAPVKCVLVLPALIRVHNQTLYRRKSFKRFMHYTQYRGLAQVTNWVKFKFAAMNLKKLAIWKWKDYFRFLLLTCSKYDRNPIVA